MFIFITDMINIPQISNYKINTYNNNKSVSFGTISRGVYENDKLKYRNDTRLFRQDLNWRIYTDYLAKKKPQRIYCYACSDGSEPYSVAISLIKKLGYEKAKPFFPIIAKDIDPHMIDRAQNGIVKMELQEFNKLNDDIQDNHEYFNILTPIITEGDKITCKVSDELAKCVEFQKGDLTKDISQLDLDNTVLMFRNVWPYLKDGEREYLLHSISKKFTDTSTLVVGCYDRQKLALQKDDNHYFDDKLWNSGLWQVKPLIYEKHNIDPDHFTISGCTKAVANEFCSNFWDFYEHLRSTFSTSQ